MDKGEKNKITIDETEIDEQIAKFKKDGERLFSTGSYIETLKHYEAASDFLLKAGKETEALFFSQKCEQMKKLIDLRKEKLKALILAKAQENIGEVIELYGTIIEISKNLNDIDGVSMYEAKLKEIDKTGENLIQVLEDKRLSLVKQALKLEKEYLFGAASDLYEQCVEISEKLMNLGKEQERIIAKFKNMKEKCLQRISKK